MNNNNSNQIRKWQFYCSSVVSQRLRQSDVAVSLGLSVFISHNNRLLRAHCCIYLATKQKNRWCVYNENHNTWRCASSRRPYRYNTEPAMRTLRRLVAGTVIKIIILNVSNNCNNNPTLLSTDWSKAEPNHLETAQHNLFVSIQKPGMYGNIYAPDNQPAPNNYASRQTQLGCDALFE